MAFEFVVVGEAPGEEEVFAGKPFVGPAGQELGRMFRDADLPVDHLARVDRDRVGLVNVFQSRPPNNDLSKWCVPKDEAHAIYRESLPGLRNHAPDYPWPETYSWPSLKDSKYLHPIQLPSLVKLRDYLREHNPTLVLAVGNTPCWALFNQTGIGKLRGTPRMGSTPVWSGKVLPTYHPAAILRQYSLRTVAVADMIKIRRELRSNEINFTSYDLIVEPSADELVEFAASIRDDDAIAVDIETSRGLVTCIGFATPRLAICIPIVKLDLSFYWTEGIGVGSTLWALDFIAKLLQLPNVKIFQNGMYDIQYIWRVLGMTVRNYSEDTMLIHHTLQPELPKGLAFLASVYTEAATWKELSALSKFKASEFKKDD